MIEGRIKFNGDGLTASLIDEHGVVLAEGALVAHPGSQSIAGRQVASAVQFSGELTDAGVRAGT
jgi:hypothetical protein